MMKLGRDPKNGRSILYQPHSSKFGGYSPNDGTLDFYGRVGLLANTSHRFLDIGAGRAQWFEDDVIEQRRQTRFMKGRYLEVIGADIDPIVSTNRTVDYSVLIENGIVPLPDHSIHVVVADYVLEHVVDPVGFSREIDRLLVPGGWFCARTPHRLHYVAIADWALPSGLAKRVLHRSQPDRKEEDVFPKVYRLNSLNDVSRAFPKWINKSFCYRTEPAYFFGSKKVFAIADFFHRLAPVSLVGNLFIFLQKPH